MTHPLIILSQSDSLIQIVDINSDTKQIENSADSDQLASSEASRSGSTHFAKVGYIQAQQDKG